jgi:hypothetical protein
VRVRPPRVRIGKPREAVEDELSVRKAFTMVCVGATLRFFRRREDRTLAILHQNTLIAKRQPLSGLFKLDTQKRIFCVFSIARRALADPLWRMFFEVGRQSWNGFASSELTSAAKPRSTSST